MDMRFGKDTKITEKSRLGFAADFFNVFNYHNFNTPSLSYTSPATFGVITGTYTPPNRTNSARWIELGLRPRLLGGPASSPVWRCRPQRRTGSCLRPEARQVVPLPLKTVL